MTKDIRMPDVTQAAQMRFEAYIEIAIRELAAAITANLDYFVLDYPETPQSVINHLKDLGYKVAYTVSVLPTNDNEWTYWEVSGWSDEEMEYIPGQLALTDKQ